MRRRGVSKPNHLTVKERRAKDDEKSRARAVQKLEDTPDALEQVEKDAIRILNKVLFNKLYKELMDALLKNNITPKIVRIALQFKHWYFNTSTLIDKFSVPDPDHEWEATITSPVIIYAYVLRLKFHYVALHALASNHNELLKALLDKRATQNTSTACLENISKCVHTNLFNVFVCEANYQKAAANIYNKICIYVEIHFSMIKHHFYKSCLDNLINYPGGLETNIKNTYITVLKTAKNKAVASLRDTKQEMSATDEKQSAATAVGSSKLSVVNNLSSLFCDPAPASAQPDSTPVSDSHTNQALSS